MKIKKIILIIILLVVLSLIFLTYKKLFVVNYKPTLYELELIRYFKEVALQSEHGDELKNIVKWKTSMKLYIIKDGPYPDQIACIKKSINKINKLVSDDFKIELVESKEESNAYLYLCKKAKVKELDPTFYEKIPFDNDNEVSGFVNIDFYWSNYDIYQTSIFINTAEDLIIQQSTILEEITQSIGLPYDPDSHKDSIFYEYKSRDNININDFSNLDKDVIKLLYHPRMESGLNEKEVQKTIIKILKNNEIVLSGE